MNEHYYENLFHIKTSGEKIFNESLNYNYTLINLN